MSDTPACAYKYTVKRGDSFYLIARRLGVPLRDLMNANPDIPPSRLMVGDTLCVPACGEGCPGAPAPEPEAPETPECPPGCQPSQPSEPDTSACPAERRATVAEGQTVADIQLQYGKSYHTLEAANPDLDLDSLKAGDTVCVPQLNLPCALPGSVVLGAGETLESTAQRFGLSVAQLLRANPCLAPGDFAAGVTVKLPQ
ncbi:MAG: LysM peptidoglycan-binding domain-containing protein [Clostridia bacterium]|nr:LysM peptidoglycan-binding domain-containing protein [Clostridia bacterium]